MTARKDLDFSRRGGIADVTAAFAGVLLFVASAFDVLQGIAAMANPDIFAEGTDYLYKLNVHAWGAIHLVLGILGIVVAVGILQRRGWAQVIGMVIAGLGALTNFMFIPVYPWWAATLIVFYLLVIWSLSVQVRKYK